ncbi:unnamed protein product [Pseudo-nitzschia multistriata]|uniref:Myosin motor domain-containing protein n=1 Tax=Pseudo-nitzschia multistriata TaxID=183589 RepID=A0A448ZBL6_9STRA|nr:unnamed protein product [Pseudo-nitzschia multistriata]
MGEGADVYIRDDEHAWVPARVVESDGTTAKVAVPQYACEEEITSDGGKAATGFKTAEVKLKDYHSGVLPLQNVNESGTLIEVNDMVDLPYLHEAAILYNLKSRHVRALPYARVADIVIAVNPYQWLTHLYEDEVRMHYAQRIVWDDNENDPRIGLDPHIYEISSLCYKGLALEKQNQSILVSGESGAGKTETVKICMNHIATVQQDPNEEKMEGMSPVVQRILDSNPLLEAFGNAKTRRNDNSSRFGKYIMLQFEHLAPEGGAKPRSALAGSACEVYLLEKSRIVTHDSVERTYHIFYQLLSSSDEIKSEIWEGLTGKVNEDFKCVGTSPIKGIDGKSDADNFTDTKSALELVGIKGEPYIELFRAISAVMQLAELVFAPDPSDDEKSVITSKKEFDDLQKLLGVEPTTLELAFTEKTIKTRGEEYKVPLKADIATESAGAFAKEIYAKTFLWLVRALNDATCAENNWPAGDTVEYGLIGLLDIFGFESFPVNGFEQLCINYCNEKLQQKFTQDIFRTVVEEYKQEGLDLEEIKYDDNSDVLALIEGKGGFIRALNEECVRPSGNDPTFVSKALKANKTVACLIQKRTFSPLEFGVHHFAGSVIYCAEGFVGRNTDTLPVDLAACAKMCKNEIISKHMDNNSASNQKKKEDPDKAPPKRAKSSMTGDTVMTQFKTQLTSLMKGLASTSSRYIRCVKPNTRKAKCVMMHNTTLDQLRSAGVVAAVTISRSAFPSKLDFPDVLYRYGILNPEKDKAYPDDKAEIDEMLTTVLKRFEKTRKDGSISKAFAVGKTKCYFKGGCLEFLESEKAKIWFKWAVKIQKVIRGRLTRDRLERERIAREEARLAAEKAERERIEAEERAKREAEEKARKEEEERLAAIEWEKNREAREEAERLEKIRLAEEAEKEKARLAEEARLEKIRLEKEKARLEEEARLEKIRLEEEAKARAEAERIAKLKAEAEEKKRIAEEKARIEAERIAAAKRAEEERIAAELRRKEEERMRAQRELENKSAITIQCMFYQYTARQRFRDRKKEKKLQKRMGKKWKKAATKIQAIARGFLQRPKYRQALLDKAEEDNLKNQLGNMEAKLEEAEQARKQELEDVKFKFEQEMEDMKEKLKEQLEEEMANAGNSAQHQTLIDESGKIIEYLRKENAKLRKQSDSTKREYKTLKEQNTRLKEANDSASKSFNELNNHAKGLNATNARLIKNVDAFKKQLVKMKEDLKNRQAFYLAEAHARVAYQKTLARIVSQVQNQSRDAQLVEDVVIWALECEAEAKAERAALENAGQKAPPGVINAAPKRAARPMDSDSDDSDSDSD